MAELPCIAVGSVFCLSELINTANRPYLPMFGFKRSIMCSCVLKWCWNVKNWPVYISWVGARAFELNVGKGYIALG